MFRLSPSRNQRSKGVKIKHVLQICVLLAVCFWLIYQVKHSHDKRKEFDENGAEIAISSKTQSGDEILKFGRKDLHPRVDEKAASDEKNEEEEDVEEKDNGREGEEKKHEKNNDEDEEQDEEENYGREKEDEGRGDRDDELDEMDQEKTEGEADREEDFIDEEKEDTDEEKENKGKEDEDSDPESAKDQDNDRSDRNEAREEHYRADDASSAVVHETQTINLDNKQVKSEKSTEHTDIDILQQDDRINKPEDISVEHNNSSLKVQEFEMAENNNLNMTAKEEKGNESILSILKGSSHLSSPTTTVSNDQPELKNNSTEVTMETLDSVLQNGTETVPGSDPVQNTLIEGLNSTEVSNLHAAVPEKANESEFYSIVSTKMVDADTKSGDISNSTSKPYPTGKENNSSMSLTNEENENTAQNEKETDETSSFSSSNEKADGLQDTSMDTSDSFIAGEEKEIHLDLDTLLQSRTEGTDIDDAAVD